MEWHVSQNKLVYCNKEDLDRHRKNAGYIRVNFFSVNELEFSTFFELEEEQGFQQGQIYNNLDFAKGYVEHQWARWKSPQTNQV